MARRPKLSDVLYAEVLDQIRSGQFEHDAKLPSENELSTRFGVSRPVVRDALRRLRIDGYIHSRQGAGSFVTAPVGGAVEHEAGLRMLPTQITSISDVQKFYDYRISLEGEAAYFAATYRTEDDIRRIGALLQSMKAQQADASGAIEEDLKFHFAIAQATHNQFFLSVWDASKSHIRFIIEMARNFAVRHSRDHTTMIRSSHEPIFECIRDGDAEGAREKMREHISRSRERVFFGKWT
ncbi:GntR family transcriptional regulator [Hyphomicrobiales bacterium]|nr:GntR family transcriptional regulator [Hyphomicrobiales bacterium]CAH1695042.1 GntR family transcriptional regulator [Hyphomicrobiales bacterium]